MLKTQLLSMHLIFWMILGFNIPTQAQQDVAKDIEFIYNWKSDSIPPTDFIGNTYNDVWGVVMNDREYAIIGSTMGTHFFDVTDPANAKEVAFVEGGYAGTEASHRDFHDYDGYLYAVCDQGIGESTLQIMDMRHLPFGFGVSIVYDSNELFTTTHNIFIDTAQAKLYACTPLTNDLIRHDLMVFSLENPRLPTLLGTYDYGDYVHDVYVRNDTAYLNVGNYGLVIADFADTDNYKELGKIDEYSAFRQGYNHSGWLTDDGNYYVFADETHGYDVKIVDVSDLSDMKIISTLNSGVDENSMAHNIMIKEDLLYISYYHDGLQIFDISDPYEPKNVGFYDTYLSLDHDFYKGAWGIYCYLPSGNLLVSDMSEGLFIFDAAADGENITTTPQPLAISSSNITAFPTLFESAITVEAQVAPTTIVNAKIYDVEGQIHLVEKLPANNNQWTIEMTKDLPAGTYFLELTTDDKSNVIRLVKE